jgi:carboxyl-terminal processing protease
MSNRFIHWPLTLAAAVSAGVLIGATLFGNSSGRDEVAQNVLRIQEVMSYIRHDYVDSVDVNDLGPYAIKGILEQLDPHSSYIPQDELTLANAQLEENFDGIGVEFVLLHDTIQVVTALPGGPSEKAGIRAGDRLVKVNGEAVAGTHITSSQVFSKLRGPSGSSVDLVIARPGASSPLRITLMRGLIPTKSVGASLMTDAKTGYIKITRFTGGTDREFKTALKDLISQKMERLVLDLRDNPGGYLDKAIHVVDEFLPNGQTITYTEGKRGKYNSTYTSTDGGMFERGAVMVLINEASASAAEIVAGALQDNDRALVVGRRSFGKGLVQMPITLNDGSELRLTISRYHTPSGRCIQKPYDGVNLTKYDQELDKRFLQGELFVEDSIHVTDTATYKTLAGRTVYGGGGIKPDVFVPLDTLQGNTLLLRMHGALLFEELGREEGRSQAKTLRATELANFMRSYKPSLQLEKELLRRAKREGITLTDGSWAHIREAATLELKAAVAQAVFGTRGYYTVLLAKDRDYLRSVGAFSQAMALMKR